MNVSPEVPTRLWRSDYEHATPSIPWTYHSTLSSQRLKLVTEEGNSFVRSIGPWWPDPNHVAPGAGWLNLIAIEYFRSYIGPSGGIGGRYQQVDLTDAVFTFRVRLENLVLPEGASLVFWFQARDPDIPPEQGQFVNYFFTGVRIEQVAEPGEWTTITIPLTSNEDDWVALGSSIARDSLYSVSSSVAHALANGEMADLGIILFLGNDYSHDNAASGSISFDDFNLVAPNATPDVVYDGLYYNRTTGAVSWYDAYGIGGSGHVPAGTVGSGLVPISVKYFGNADTQIILRNASTGEVGYWEVFEGRKIGSYAPISLVDPSWSIQAPSDSSDFNGDGFDDIVWRAGDGTIVAWLMKDGVKIGTEILGVAPAGWNVAATGDVTGDGVDDIVWFSPAEGRVAYWEIREGKKYGSEVDLGRSSLEEVIGVGDLDGDGVAEIIVRNKVTGAVSYFDIVEGSKGRQYYLGDAPAASSIVGIRDINGDGRADLLFESGSPGSASVALESRSGIAVSEIEAGVFQLRKNAGEATKFDASAVSATGFASDFTLSIQLASGLVDAYIGMNAHVADSGPGSLDFAWRLRGDGAADIYVNNRLISVHSVDGAVWIWREGTVLRFGIGPDFQTARTTGLWRTVQDVTDTLYFDSSFRTLGGIVEVDLSGVSSSAMTYWSIEPPLPTVSPAAPDAPLIQSLHLARDLDGNGYDDIVTRDETGWVHVALLDENGSQIDQRAVGLATLDWQLVGYGELTGNGTDDLLWYQPSVGRVGYWNIADGRKSGGYRDIVIDPTREPVGLADLQNDGIADILWRDKITGEFGYSQVVNGRLGEHYSILSGALSRVDWDGNGYNDILSRDGAGWVYVSLVDANGDIFNFKRIGQASLIWEPVGVGDLTGDGIDDMLWYAPSLGRVGYWQIEDGVKLGGYRDIVTDPAREPIGLGDFQGDGTDDILWRDKATGELVYSEVLNGQLAGEYYFGDPGGPINIAGIYDADGNGIDDVLIENSTTQDLFLWTPFFGPEVVPAGHSLPGYDFLF